MEARKLGSVTTNVTPKSSAARPRIPPRPSPAEAGTNARERIIRAAYELFTSEGLAAVGVDRIVAEAAVAKTTLYRHFRSKDALIATVVERHHRLWFHGWFEPQTHNRGESPPARLIALFDSIDDWLGDKDFQGCFLTNTILEIHDRNSAPRRVSNDAIGDVYGALLRLAIESGAPAPDRLALQIHLLIRGAIVAASEGRLEAVREAREAARSLLEHGLPK